jgi:hypothetical protein
MDGPNRVVLALAVLASLCVHAFAQEGGPGDEPAARAEASGAEFDSAEALLTALEEADRDLRTLRARVMYVRVFDIVGDEQRRDGTLYFRSRVREGERPDRAFAIDFDTLLVGRRKEDIKERYVFDGQWLLELDFATRHFTRRQVVAPGETFDPLRIGEGPFPIPIGQRKDEILARYDTELVDATDGLLSEALRGRAEGTSQIMLTPRPFFAEESDFKQIRLWYSRDEDGRLLPRMARTVNYAGDEATVILTDVDVNERAAIPDDRFETRPPRGWDGQVIEFRADGRGDG